jgi:hypothetical protein
MRREEMSERLRALVYLDLFFWTIFLVLLFLRVFANGASFESVCLAAAGGLTTTIAGLWIAKKEGH